MAQSPVFEPRARPVGFARRPRAGDYRTCPSTCWQSQGSSFPAGPGLQEPSQPRLCSSHCISSCLLLPSSCLGLTCLFFPVSWGCLCGPAFLLSGLPPSRRPQQACPVLCLSPSWHLSLPQAGGVHSWPSTSSEKAGRALSSGYHFGKAKGRGL